MAREITGRQAEGIGVEIALRVDQTGRWRGHVSAPLAEKIGSPVLVQTDRTEGDSVPPLARTFVYPDGRREDKPINLD